MAAKGETGKDGTNTTSSASTAETPRSLLRDPATVGPCRTAEDILRINEQILDALQHGLITPKMAEQLGQCIKQPVALVNVEMKYHRHLHMFGRKVPVPRSPLLRALIPGLDPDKVLASDGQKVRALVEDATEK
jgi:hypothetical protein